MLRTAEAAKHLSLSESTLEKLRLTGNGPKYIKLGRTVVYKPEDLDEWIDSNRRSSTTEDRKDDDIISSVARLIAGECKMSDASQWANVYSAAQRVLTKYRISVS